MRAARSVGFPSLHILVSRRYPSLSRTTRMLADAHQLYEESGRACDRPALNAEVLATMVEELTHRIAEADPRRPTGRGCRS